MIGSYYLYGFGTVTMILVFVQLIECFQVSLTKCAIRPVIGYKMS